MNNFFTRLAHWVRSLFRREELLRIEIDRPLQEGERFEYTCGMRVPETGASLSFVQAAFQKVSRACKRPEPVEFSPPLTFDQENGMLKVFATRDQLFKQLTIENYWGAYKAEIDMWLSKMTAQQKAVEAYKASKEAE